MNVQHDSGQQTIRPPSGTLKSVPFGLFFFKSVSGRMHSSRSMLAGDGRLGGAPPAPFRRPAGKEGTQQQGADRCIERDAIGRLETPDALVAGNLQAGQNFRPGGLRLARR